MKNTFFRLLPVACLLAALACPAAAQTARIAHLSHSGSAAKLDAAADNFGEISVPFIVDSVRATSDTSAIEYGKFGYRGHPKSDEGAQPVQFGDKGGRQRYIKYYQRNMPSVKLIGFDSTVKTALTPPLKKQKPKRKKSAFLPTTAPAPPRHAGVALTVAAILVLTGAGWLLGEQRPRPQPAV